MCAPCAPLAIGGRPARILSARSAMSGWTPSSNGMPVTSRATTPAVDDESIVRDERAIPAVLVGHLDPTERAGHAKAAHPEAPADVDEGGIGRRLEPGQGDVLDRRVVCPRGDPGGHPLDGSAEERLCEVDDVEHVHQHAAACLPAVVAPGRPVGRVARVVADPEPVEDGDLDGPDLVGRDQLERPDHLVEEQVVVHDRQRPVRRLRRLDHRPGIARRRRQGLLGQDMTAAPSGGDDQVAMEVLRRTDVDEIEIRPREQGRRVGVAIIGSQAARDAPSSSRSGVGSAIATRRYRSGIARYAGTWSPRATLPHPISPTRSGSATIELTRPPAKRADRGGRCVMGRGLDLGRMTGHQAHARACLRGPSLGKRGSPS